MKKLFTKMQMIIFLIILNSTVYCQIQPDEVRVPDPSKAFVTFKAPVRYFFVNKANDPGLVIKDSVNGWYLDKTISDDFNGTRIDPLKWIKDFGWSNTEKGSMNYNDSTNFMFSTDLSGVKYLRMFMKEEYIEGKRTWLPSNQMDTEDNLPNLRTYYYTTGMLRSYSQIEPYGFYELRCRIPDCRFIKPCFWLYGSGANQDYGDLNYEIMNGRQCYISTNLAENIGFNEWDTTYKHTSISNLINEPLSRQNQWYRLAIKWEPKRVTFYINDVIVKTVNEHIPNSNVFMLINVGGAFFNSSYVDPFNFPSFFDVDYIKRFKRVQNNNYVDFTINNDSRNINSYIIDDGPKYDLSPIQLKQNQKILLNGNLPECFNWNVHPEHVYYLSVKECNQYGVPVTDGIYFSKHLTLSESMYIDKFDLTKFCLENNIALLPGKYYRIKLATSDNWVQTIRVIKINSCENFADFTINGKSGSSNCSIIDIDYNNLDNTNYEGFPMIVIDLSKVITCNDRYFLSIQKCDEYCNTLGPEDIISNITQSDRDKYSLNFLDLRQFCADKKFKVHFDQNSYYKIKVGTGESNTWVEKSLIMHIKPCNCNVDILVNDQTRSDNTPVEIYKDDPLYYDNGSKVLLSINPLGACSDTFKIKIREVTGTDTIVEKQYINWFQNKYKSNTTINLDGGWPFTGYEFFKVPDDVGKTYEVVVTDLHNNNFKSIYMHFNGEMCKPTKNTNPLISGAYINSIELKNFFYNPTSVFTIETGYDGGYRDVRKLCPIIRSNGSRNLYFSIRPSLKNFTVPSNYRHVYTVWLDKNSNNVFDPASELLWHREYTSILSLASSTITFPSSLTYGKKRLRFIYKCVPNDPNSPNDPYHINDPCNVPTGFGEVEDYTINYTSSATPSQIANNAELKSEYFNFKNDSLIEDNILIIPNPNKGLFKINLPDYFGACKIEVFNLSGSIVYSNSIKNEDKIDISDEANGIYLVRITNSNNVLYKSIVIQK